MVAAILDMDTRNRAIHNKVTVSHTVAILLKVMVDMAEAMVVATMATHHADKEEAWVLEEAQHLVSVQVCLEA